MIVGLQPGSATSSFPRAVPCLDGSVDLHPMEKARRARGAEMPRGFGFPQAKPTRSFSPVAQTPDGLGTASDGDKLSLPIPSSVNGRVPGRAKAGHDMFVG